jgi:hypothetical protein
MGLLRLAGHAFSLAMGLLQLAGHPFSLAMGLLQLAGHPFSLATGLLASAEHPFSLAMRRYPLSDCLFSLAKRCDVQHGAALGWCRRRETAVCDLGGMPAANARRRHPVRRNGRDSPSPDHLARRVDGAASRRSPLEKDAARATAGALCARLGAGALLVFVSGCERGCARGWLLDHGVGSGSAPWAESASSSVARSLAMNVVDCPDGLGRCSAGSIEVSRLAMIPQPCRGPQSVCACPWELMGSCEHGCVADGLEVVVGRAQATTQLCAPEPDAVFAVPPSGREGEGGATDLVGCDEGQLYRCAGGRIVDCAVHAAVASCVHGCSEDGAFVEEGIAEHVITREAAFAILCSR